MDLSRYLDEGAERRNHINYMANRTFETADEARKEGDIEYAIKSYAIAWGFYSLNEIDINMRLCDLRIKLLDDDVDLQSTHEYGMGVANYCFDLLATLSEVLGKPNPLAENHNLPKDIF
jgi:hypothetical protein